MRCKPTRAVVSTFVVISALAGCIDPVEMPEGPPPEAGSDRLADGWSFEDPGGRLHYEEGKLRGSYEGDQILLEVESDDPIDLGGLSWIFEGELDVDEDDSYSYVMAFWREGDDWPIFWMIDSFVREYAGGRAEALGLTVNETVYDPQRAVWRVLYPGNSSGEYSMEIRFTDDASLEAGEWKIWLGMPHSKKMQVELELPELVLRTDPVFASGCKVVQPSASQAALMVQVVYLSSIVIDAHWEFDVPNGSSLFGAYHGGAATGIQNAERRFAFPDGTSWEFRQEPAKASQASPTEWDGKVIASVVPGKHGFQVAHDQSAGIVGPPKIIYCVA